MTKKRTIDPALPIHVVAGEYHKYRIWGMRNPKWTESCGRMLDLKDPKHPSHSAAIQHFGKKVASALAELVPSRKHPIVVAIVPGHSKDSISAGMQTIVANHLWTAFNFVNKYYPLRRHTDAEKRAKGGDRSPENIFDTVEVVAGTITPGCTVVLLDDVTTTGASLRACACLLKEAGAANVICMALMKTVHD
jgi:predicted amidophosphoribosyltransferase